MTKFEDDVRPCLNTALELLGSRDHSSHELAVKLARRGYDPSQITEAIADCQRWNYLDDAGFCRRYTAQLRRRGYGRYRIEQMLKAKGVARDLIDAHLLECGLDEAQWNDCRQVMAKKLKMVARCSPDKTKARLYRFLISRGFSSDIVGQLLSETTWEDF